MAEELKRHEIAFSLDLNKHPKNATNLSLINAENFKVSEDGANLISDKTLNTISTLNNYINESYTINHIISTNNEIVIFASDAFDSENESGKANLFIYRYNESIDVCKQIPILKKLL